MKKIIAPFVLVLILVACSNTTVYREFEKFSDMNWMENQVPKFTITIENDTILYDMYLAFRYVQGFPLADMKLSVTETNPANETQMYPLIFTVRNSDGSYVGDGSGDIWDIEYKFKEGIAMQKGEYTFALEQEIAEKLPLVMEVGLILKQTEQ